MTSLAADSVEPAARFAERLVAWQRRNGRHDLPWQRDPTPYRVWISEIMLQQTQVSAVIGYYERFMERFPDIQTLAGAEVDEVLHLWSGLGYYSRARNLHAAARQVVEAHAGVFPNTLDALEALPGIGRSTAGAVLALALGQSHAILDGNAKRVLCRHRGIEGWPGATATLRTLWQLAAAQTPAQQARRYTQAIMDIGATVCVRTKPRCLLCPVEADCVARLEGSIDRIPAPKPKRQRPMRHARFLLVRDREDRVLLERRPPTGVWGGLWSFPELTDLEAPHAWCLRVLGAAPREVLQLADVHHGFTHFELTITPLLAHLDSAPVGVAAEDTHLWFDVARPARVGLAAPVARLLGALPARNERPEA